MSRARGYDAWRPRTASEDAAFWARRSGLARLPPPPPTGPTHVLLEHEELPAPRCLIVGEAVAVPGAARQRGRAILARLALKLRAVSGLRDVALDLPGEPAPAPAAGAALADFRRRVAAAAAQTAPSQADADAEARRRAKEAKRERNRRIREEKERRARKKAAKEAKRAAAAAAAS